MGGLSGNTASYCHTFFPRARSVRLSHHGRVQAGVVRILINYVKNKLDYKVKICL